MGSEDVVAPHTDCERDEGRGVPGVKGPADGAGDVRRHDVFRPHGAGECREVEELCQGSEGDVEEAEDRGPRPR